jgi:two-component system, LytTR family, sensor kinase
MISRTFSISAGIIWTSSIALGLLSSVPEIAKPHFNFAEASVNSAITTLFALFVWYYNIYTLPLYASKKKNSDISYVRLLISLSVGIGVMFGLAVLQQLILSHINFGPVMLMVEVRGILINLLFYLFLQLLYQDYTNQKVNVALEHSESDNLSAQYELLKQQVNPHFLFNSLNTLKSMVDSGDGKSGEFVLKLADFYRFTLENRKTDLIPLAEEMEIVDAYLFLLKERFEDGFKFNNTIGDEYRNIFIPPFTLQLILENCIKHNIVSVERPLHIQLYINADFIVVENQLQPKKGQQTSLGVGLQNISQRYEHLINKPIEIILSETAFKIKLPVIHEHNHH